MFQFVTFFTDYFAKKFQQLKKIKIYKYLKNTKKKIKTFKKDKNV